MKWGISPRELSGSIMEDTLGGVRDEILKSHTDELEEILLACLAAGVPADCIELRYEQPNVKDYRVDTPIMMTTEIHFKYRL